MARYLPSLQQLHVGGQPVAPLAAAAAGRLLGSLAGLQVFGLRRCLQGKDGLRALVTVSTDALSFGSGKTSIAHLA